MTELEETLEETVQNEAIVPTPLKTTVAPGTLQAIYSVAQSYVRHNSKLVYAHKPYTSSDFKVGLNVINYYRDFNTMVAELSENLSEGKSITVNVFFDKGQNQYVKTMSPYGYTGWGCMKKTNNYEPAGYTSDGNEADYYRPSDYNPNNNIFDFELSVRELVLKREQGVVNVESNRLLSAETHYRPTVTMGKPSEVYAGSGNSLFFKRDRSGVKKGYATNCTNFVLQCLLGVPYLYSTYNSNYNKNSIGRAGYCFNPWQEKITSENVDDYEQANALYARFLELGLGEKIHSDWSNISAGDVLWRRSDNANDVDKFSDHVGICLGVANNNIFDCDPNSTPMFLIADCSNRSVPVQIKWYTLAGMLYSKWYYVGKPTYQVLPTRECVKLFEADSLTQETVVYNSVDYNNNSKVRNNDILTFEFDFLPSHAAGEYVEILANNQLLFKTTNKYNTMCIGKRTLQDTNPDTGTSSLYRYTEHHIIHVPMTISKEGARDNADGNAEYRGSNPLYDFIAYDPAGYSIQKISIAIYKKVNDSWEKVSTVDSVYNDLTNLKVYKGYKC